MYGMYIIKYTVAISENKNIDTISLQLNTRVFNRVPKSLNNVILVEVLSLGSIPYMEIELLVLDMNLMAMRSIAWVIIIKLYY